MEKKASGPKENDFPKRLQHTTRLKVVIRYLPANLSEQTFKTSIQTWLDEEQIEWLSFFPGKISSNRNKNDKHARAYIKFKSPEALITFYKGFNGHSFTDEKGKEQRVLIEFSPFQKIPRPEKEKHDARQGTIDEDPEYIAFQETLKNPNKNIQEQPVQNKQEDDDSAPIDAITPLIEYLRTQKEAAALKSKHQRKYTEKKASLQAKGDTASGKNKSQGGFGSMKKFNKDKNKFQKEQDNPDARKESSMHPNELFPKSINPHKRNHKNIAKKDSSVTITTPLKILKHPNREKLSNSNMPVKEKTYNSPQLSKNTETVTSSTTRTENNPKKINKKYYDYTRQPTHKESKDDVELFNKSSASFRGKGSENSTKNFGNKNTQ